MRTAVCTLPAFRLFAQQRLEDVLQTACAGRIAGACQHTRHILPPGLGWCGIIAACQQLQLQHAPCSNVLRRRWRLCRHLQPQHGFRGIALGRRRQRLGPGAAHRCRHTRAQFLRTGHQRCIALFPGGEQLRQRFAVGLGRQFLQRQLRMLHRLALGTQQTTLFNDTVANNIAYGDLAGTPRADIEKAAEAAYAKEFIEKLPDTYDTLVGENGVLLSGGQRQRLAIARAILKDAPILVLDEATSALDTESERHIQNALDHVMQNRTTLVIAHRLSTIEKADVIMVMDQGRIVERGSHGELMDASGRYRAMVMAQVRGEDREELYGTPTAYR